jgi:CRP/FNR family transcriptional regulator, cyclic AMP receptor protein
MSTAQARRTVALLDVDPGLGGLLTAERRASAHRELGVSLISLAVGEWDAKAVAENDPIHLGLLVIEGVLARELVLESTVSTELLGPGDLIRPWAAEAQPELLEVDVRWNVLSPVQLALLDRRAGARVASYPEIGAMLLDRMSARAQRIAIAQAISKLTKVEDRLVALLWHLAERWGRVGVEGVIVPLALSHRVLGELVGARRPTVSTALAELARAGRVARRPDGTWLMLGQPPLGTAADVAVVPQRRRLFPPEAPAQAREQVPRLDDLRASFEAAQQVAEQRGRDLAALADRTQELRRTTLALRRERAARNRGH